MAPDMSLRIFEEKFNLLLDSRRKVTVITKNT